jgi:hypothetical protein
MELTTNEGTHDMAHEKVLPSAFVTNTYVSVDIDGFDDDAIDWWRIVHIHQRGGRVTVVFELYNGEAHTQAMDSDDDAWVVQTDAFGAWVRAYGR